MGQGKRNSRNANAAEDFVVRRLSRLGLGLGAALLLTTLIFLAAGCGGDDSSSSATTATISNTPQDQAARLAAQAQLRNAQTAQETYFVQNQSYAPSLGDLKKYNAGLNSKVVVVSADKNGYEMQVTSNDSTQTVFIVRRTDARIERVDADGNPW